MQSTPAAARKHHRHAQHSMHIMVNTLSALTRSLPQALEGSQTKRAVVVPLWEHLVGTSYRKLSRDILSTLQQGKEALQARLNCRPRPGGGSQHMRCAETQQALPITLQRLSE
jgi:hypothetical protein